jgi:hypothetical protein
MAARTTNSDHTTEPSDMRRMVEVAAAIAEATGGIILDDDGFPWQ